MKGKSKPLILVLSSNFLKIILIVLGITIKEGGDRVLMLHVEVNNIMSGQGGPVWRIHGVDD